MKDIIVGFRQTGGHFRRDKVCKVQGHGAARYVQMVVKGECAVSTARDTSCDLKILHVVFIITANIYILFF